MSVTVSCSYTVANVSCHGRPFCQLSHLPCWIFVHRSQSITQLVMGAGEGLLG